VLFVVDPLAGLQADIDASVGLMAATQELGADVWTCEPEDLEVVGGRVRARAQRLVLAPRHRGSDHRWVVVSPWHEVVESRTLDVASDVDVTLLRIDPPVDARYLHTTYLLDLVVSCGGRVANSPAGIRALHEKLLALRFPHLSPETVVTADPATVRDLVARVGAAVVKPVDGFAGLHVWLLRDDDCALSLAESATHGGRRHVIAQAYLADVEQGNKRLFLLDGDIVGAVLRRPSPTDFRIGAPVARAELDADDLAISAALGPVLAEHGIVMAGLDVIAGRLIEVNVTCPGGMHKTDALLGTDLSGATMRRLLVAPARAAGLPVAVGQGCFTLLVPTPAHHRLPRTNRRAPLTQARAARP
jgi:glutathione synthase